MSGGKKRSGFQITSVTSDFIGQSEASLHEGSSSNPSTPSVKRKYSSHDASGSRFRVVRLGGVATAGSGRGLVVQRGRWTCSDFLDRQEGAGLRRVLNDSLRHAHSLESLQLIGREPEWGGVHSQDTRHHSGPPSPTMHLSPREPITAQQPLNLNLQPIIAQHSEPPPPSPRQRLVPPPLKLDRDAEGRSVLRLSHSQPGSPVPTPFHPDHSFFTDHSSSSSSLIAIDNKIEQAMDLVKSHLMLAVREEVELLRERIRQLERENLLLRALTHTHT